jgi:hypothetical protein
VSRACVWVCIHICTAAATILLSVPMRDCGCIWSLRTARQSDVRCTTPWTRRSLRQTLSCPICCRSRRVPSCLQHTGTQFCPHSVRVPRTQGQVSGEVPCSAAGDIREGAADKSAAKTHSAPALCPRPAEPRTRAHQRAHPGAHTNSFTRIKRAGTGWHEPGATQHTAKLAERCRSRYYMRGLFYMRDRWPGRDGHAPAHLTRRPTAGSTSLPTICSSRLEDLRKSPSRASELMSAQDSLCQVMWHRASHPHDATVKKKKTF